MNILLLCNKLPYPPKDGGSIATLNISKGLAELGYNVTILSLNTNKHYFDIKKIPAELTRLIKFDDVFVNTKIKPIKAILNFLFSNTPYIAERFKSKKFENKLIQYLTNYQFDIIQIEGLYMCMYINVIRKYVNAKISYRAHNIEYEIWQRLFEKSRKIIKRIYLKNLAKRIKRLDYSLINRYDFLIPITQRDADKYIQMGNQVPIHICPAGFDFNNEENFNKQESKYSVFFIGALDWIPNQEGLLWFLNEVWNKIDLNTIDKILYIAGRNAPDNFIHLINKFNIEFLGEVENAHKFMEDKSIMVVPLFSGSGMRVKIIEGMAMGKTIISTSIGAEGIEYNNNENILIADSAEDFINILKQLDSNLEMGKNISINARLLVQKKYNNTILARSVADFYKQNISH